MVKSQAGSRMDKILHTKLCDLLETESRIILARMGMIARAASRLSHCLWYMDPSSNDPSSGLMMQASLY